MPALAAESCALQRDVKEGSVKKMAFIFVLAVVVTSLVCYVLAQEGHFDGVMEKWRKRRDYRAFDRMDRKARKQAERAQKEKDEIYGRLPGIKRR